MPPLLVLGLSGCFLMHGPDGDAPIDPPVDPPVDPPIPDGELFVFRRGEPDPPINYFARELHVLDVSRGSSSPLFTAAEPNAYSVVQGAGRTVVATVSDGSGELRSHVLSVDGDRFETGYAGTPHLSEDGRTVVHLTNEAIVQLSADGEELVHVEVAGSGGVVSPTQRTVVRPQMDLPGAVTIAALPVGSTWNGTVDGAFGMGPVFFTTEDRVAYVATTGELGVWTAPSYTVHRVDTRTAHTVLTPLEVGADKALAGVDRCTDTLYFVGGAGEVTKLERGAELVGVGDGAGAPATALTRPFAEASALSPDGEHLVWLGNDGRMYVAELDAGTVTPVDMPALPVPSECCGDVFTDVVIGNFVDGAVSVGVAPPAVRYICSCAPIDPATEASAFRIDLATATAEQIEHCGRSTPWLTADGAMLVCREDERGVRLGLAVDDGFEPLTDGPFDVGAFPLSRPAACGVPAR